MGFGDNNIENTKGSPSSLKALAKNVLDVELNKFKKKVDAGNEENEENEEEFSYTKKIKPDVEDLEKETEKEKKEKEKKEENDEWDNDRPENLGNRLIDASNVFEDVVEKERKSKHWVVGWDKIKSWEFLTWVGFLFSGLKFKLTTFFKKAWKRINHFLNKFLWLEDLETTEDDEEALPKETSKILEKIKENDPKTDLSEQRGAEVKKVGLNRYFYSRGKRVQIGRHPDDQSKFKIGGLDVAFPTREECLMAANLSNKVVGMYQESIANTFVRNAGDLVLNKEAFDLLVDLKGPTLKYSERRGLVKEAGSLNVWQVSSVLLRIWSLDIKSARQKIRDLKAQIKSTTVVRDKTMQKSFPTLYQERDVLVDYLNDRISNIDRKDWIDFLSGNYAYTGPKS